MLCEVGSAAALSDSELDRVVAVCSSVKYGKGKIEDSAVSSYVNLVAVIVGCRSNPNDLSASLKKTGEVSTGLNLVELEVIGIISDSNGSSCDTGVVRNNYRNDNSVTINGSDGHSGSVSCEYGRAESYEHNCYHCNRKKLLHFCPP